MYPFEERLQYGEYVTAQLTQNTPIYDWYTFLHSFSRELVYELLEEFNVPAQATVFDPFVGTGTTLLACREKGISAFGIDQLPLSVFITNTKLRNYYADQLQNKLNNMSTTRPTKDVFGDIPTVDRSFSDAVRNKISSIYQWLKTLSEKESSFFLLALLYILEGVSQTQKSGGWLRYIENDVSAELVEELFLARAQKMIADLQQSALPYNNGYWSALPSDARYKHRSNKSADYVITSPPYLNRHDYTRVFALEMALEFVSTNKELIDIRHSAFRSHVEAQSSSYSLKDHTLPTALTSLLPMLVANLSKNDKRRVPRMIKGYFEDMYLTLNSLYYRVNRGGKIAFVLGNVRFGGVMIPVDELVAEIGEQVGLSVDKIIIARYRGNSAQQMAEYGRVPSRESIIIWSKV